VPDESTKTPRWLSLASAAATLNETPKALRNKLERAARRANDGAIEAELNGGVRGRKLGRLWKVRLSESWL
jgi:hypothetical protein